MNNQSIENISPIDGRYAEKTVALKNFFSEAALIKYRLIIEIEYFIALLKTDIPPFSKTESNSLEKRLRTWIENFDLTTAEKVKTIEKQTNHDVKSIEYYLREVFTKLGVEEYKEFIHFGLTSQDINNTAIPLSLRDYCHLELYPSIERLIETIEQKAKSWESVVMLSHTHGQPASPTRMGKELKVFAERLKKQLTELKRIPFSAKFGGATGNFNAHYAAFPNYDWDRFADDFVNNTLGLNRSKPTTQIEHYDFLAAFFDALKRISSILIDLSQDIWLYISMHYFTQKIKKNEVGSSAMPHKVNPIDFENAEGNLGIVRSFCDFLSQKLPISRLQRDLSDSTVTRNVGVPLAYFAVAIASLIKGLSKIEINKKQIDNDLEENWIVVAEAIQTILRRENYPNPYDLLKELTRTNVKTGKAEIHKFINALEISENLKKELLQITPHNYCGR